MTINNVARLIAFYLPQFHPIPENDVWWGKGFTEWVNVTKAKPLFPGHYQPHIPADLGFYDLRLPETRIAQAEMAKEYNIEGFCYWHYWFNGKRLLEAPFDAVLTSGRPDYPFCLAWVNESWSRRWLGEEKDILQPQTYSKEDDRNHARWLVRVLADPRCIRVGGRPLFLIYRPADLPQPKRTTDIFREECARNSLPDPFLLGINAHNWHLDCRQIGFDGTVNFEPQLGVLPGFPHEGAKTSKLLRNLRLGVVSPKLRIYEYASARRLMMSRRLDYPFHPCIFVGWDNTPRRGANAIIMVNSDPEHFESGLLEAVQSVVHKPHDNRLVFLCAWNEWAEGNHLEPDLRNGLGYLEAVKRVNSLKKLD